MPRCKAPETLRVASRRIRSDFLPRRRVGESAGGVLGRTPQRRRIKETLQMGVFQQLAKGRRGVEGEQMVAPSEIVRGRNSGGRKVRAPQGRVVRNADCSGTVTAQDFGVRKVPQKRYRPDESRDKGEKARQELTSTLSDLGSLVNPTRSKTK